MINYFVFKCHSKLPLVNFVSWDNFSTPQIYFQSAVMLLYIHTCQKKKRYHYLCLSLFLSPLIYVDTSEVPLMLRGKQVSPWQVTWKLYRYSHFPFQLPFPPLSFIFESWNILWFCPCLGLCTCYSVSSECTFSAWIIPAIPSWTSSSTTLCFP